jgi:hypothetical protein
MERAPEVPVDHSAADRQIGAKMWAERVQQRWLTLQRAEEHELAAKGSNGHHL